jgi:2-polyprenyl-3-methyl-5-hydroxy-6-metoxy-1,4-benzoquinol methylase
MFSTTQKMKIIKDLELKFFDIDARRLRPKNFYKGIVDYREKILPKHRHLIKKPNEYICTLCGGVNGLLFLEWVEGYQLYECDFCGAVSPNIDRPGKESNIESIYDNEDYRKKFMRETHNQFNYRKSQYGQERYQYSIERLGLSNSARVLDLGCGAGYFLSVLADKGIDYKGLEVAEHLTEYCQSYHGLNVEPSNLEDEPDERYNLITMFDVLEHLSDPVKLLGVVKTKIKKGGYCIAYTPNIHSIGYELMGSKQNTLLPFEHFCFFNTKSFDYLANKAGLKIYSIETYGLDLMDYLLMKEDEDGVDYIDSLGEMMNLLQAVLDKHKVSNHFRITFQKI